MTAEYDLAELERLEKAATPGPMFQDCDLLFVQGKEINRAVAYVSSGMDDAALLRALRNAAPAMLRDLRELEARRKGEWKDLGADNAALRELAGRMLALLERHHRVTQLGLDIHICPECDRALPLNHKAGCEWEKAVNDARKLGLGG